MVSTFLSFFFAVLSLLVTVINLLFIAENADRCGQYKINPSVQNKSEIRRYGQIVFIFGALGLFFIALSFLASYNTAKKMVVFFGVYKVVIPISVWRISFLTPGKKIWTNKTKKIIEKPATT